MQKWKEVISYLKNIDFNEEQKMKEKTKILQTYQHRNISKQIEINHKTQDY